MIPRLLTIAYIVAWVLLFSWAVHGSTAPLPRHPHFPIDKTTITKHGAVIDGQILGREDVYTNIRFQPYGTPLLYDENILLCGYVGDQFFGMTGPIEIRFEAVSHRMYQGIGCHELRGVQHWSPPAKGGW